MKPALLVRLAAILGLFACTACTSNNADYNSFAAYNTEGPGSGSVSSAVLY